MDVSPHTQVKKENGQAASFVRNILHIVYSVCIDIVIEFVLLSVPPSCFRVFRQPVDIITLTSLINFRKPIIFNNYTHIYIYILARNLSGHVMYFIVISNLSLSTILICDSVVCPRSRIWWKFWYWSSGRAVQKSWYCPLYKPLLF